MAKHQKSHLTVRAPIITPGVGVQPFLDYMAAYGTHSNVEAAEQEGARLAPYFEAMSKHLQKTTTLKREEVSPKRLRQLFTDIAAYTGSTILSDIAIFPMNFLNKERIKSKIGLECEYECGKYKFNFGFLCAEEKSHRPSYSTAIPFFAIDKSMMTVLESHDQSDLLEHFQAAMSFVNHDMLHHYTSLIVADEVSPEQIDHVYETPVYKWHDDLRGDYEAWAHISHEEIILDPQNVAFAKRVHAPIEKYFSGLKVLADKMTRAGASKTKVHDIVDYFGVIMLHALARVFPLDHVVMKRGAALMQKADPAPEQFAKDYRNFRSHVLSYHWLLEESYKKRGFSIFPEDEEKASYADYVMLKLADLGGLETHVPKINKDNLPALRKNMGKLNQKMLQAVVKTISKKSWKPS